MLVGLVLCDCTTLQSYALSVASQACIKNERLNLSVFCFSVSAPYVHGHATAVRGGEGGRQHYSDLHCLRKPQAGGHLAERGRSADQQQEIHGKFI